ncbi:putative bifunctional diguanylate cyclase/phosphodiesterase [Marinovum sp. KMM 9879]
MPVTTLQLPRAPRRFVQDLTISALLPVLFPALALGGYWLGGEPMLAAFAIGVPLIWLSVMIGAAGASPATTDPITGLELREGFTDRTAAILNDCRASGRTSACFMIEVDDTATLTERFGVGACDRVLDTLATRLRASMRGNDMFVRLGDWRIAVVLDPIRRIDLESAVQMAARLQAEMDDPVRIDRAPVYVSASIGFCLAARVPQTDAAAWIDATAAALDEARKHGPGAIRAFSPDLLRNRSRKVALLDEAARALEDGQIQPWYQPQISTETGQITGLEALARWQHPVRGLISPAEFLPALEAAGLTGRLGEVVLFHALTTLRDFERDGVYIPQIGVNFTEAELRNPRLAQRIAWEVDRFNLSPDRLTIEILEHVVAGTPDDVVTRNITALAGLGCTIDLDDFGTGHASITSLRRFAVDRLKIDRSFVVKCDTDPDQQRMVTTILTMAEKLGLETLAEGVETVGENTLLSQLGCGHVQGFGIAVPMPTDNLRAWISEHNARIVKPPQITPLPGSA